MKQICNQFSGVRGESRVGAHKISFRTIKLLSLIQSSTKAKVSRVCPYTSESCSYIITKQTTKEGVIQ